MLDIDFIKNLNYTLQNKQAFWDYFGGHLWSIILVIIFSVLVGWLIRKIWKSSKRNFIIYFGLFIIFIIPIIPSIYFGGWIAMGTCFDYRLYPYINILWMIYVSIVVSFWIFCWIRNQLKKKKKILGFTIALFTIIFLSIILLGNFTKSFRESCFSPAGPREIIKNEIEKISLEAEGIYKDTGSYENFNCGHNKDTIKICNDIDRACALRFDQCKGDDAEGGKQDLIIHSNQKNYCIYSPFPCWPDSWYCVNSKGIAREVNVNPGNSYCTEDSFECPK